MYNMKQKAKHARTHTAVPERRFSVLSAHTVLVVRMDPIKIRTCNQIMPMARTIEFVVNKLVKHMQSKNDSDERRGS